MESLQELFLRTCGKGPVAAVQEALSARSASGSGSSSAAGSSSSSSSEGAHGGSSSSSSSSSSAEATEQLLLTLPPALKRELARSLSQSAAWADNLLPLSFFQGSGIQLLSFAGSGSRASPSYILGIVRACPELLGLDLTSSFSLEDEHVRQLLAACPKLRYLCLVDCRKLTDAALEALVQQGSALRHLDIGGCASMTGAGLKALLERLPRAEHFTGLGLSGVEGLSAEALRLLAARFTGLARLSVGYYAGGEAALIAVLKKLQGSLVSLDVHWPRSQVTDELALELTRDGCFSKLCMLNLQGNKGMSMDGFAAIVNCHQRRPGAPAPEWSSWELLEWCALCGLQAESRGSGAMEVEAAAAAAGGGGGGGGGAGSPGLLLPERLGPGIALVVARYSCKDSSATTGLKEYVAKSSFNVRVE